MFKINANTFVTHRINAITDEGFETKGDANPTIDNVIGKESKANLEHCRISSPKFISNFKK